MGGMIASVHTVSLRKAWLPRPTAKNAYRQLSCSSRPGRVSPRARNASRAVPLSKVAVASEHAPVTMPTTRAVPVQLATARRQT